MTYGSQQVADEQQMTQLLEVLQEDLNEARHMLSIYADAVQMPGRNPNAGADDMGRKATTDPGRPTENTALDESRGDLQAELKAGAPYLIQAIALVRGTTASMDRALSRWEGEDEIHAQGEPS